MTATERRVAAALRESGQDQGLAMAACYRGFGWSSNEVGRAFERDHSTVLYHVEKHDGTERLAKVVEQLKHQFPGG